MLCRLCIGDCGHSAVELLDDCGQNTAACNVVAKYFQRELSNINEIKEEIEFEFEQCMEFSYMNSKVICENCWLHIEAFHRWQEEVEALQDERIKLLRQPYEGVETVKLEIEMANDLEVSKLNGIFNEKANEDAGCANGGGGGGGGGGDGDNNDNEDGSFCNEDIEDPVAINENGSSQDSDGQSRKDGGKYELDDHDYDNLPLKARKKITMNKRKNDIAKKTRMVKKPTTKRENGKKSSPKVEKSKIDELKDDEEVDGDDQDVDTPEKQKEKSMKTKQFDAFIALHFKEQLPCDLCEQQFPDFTVLRAHYRDIHNNNKGYVICCRHKYSQRFHLVEHLQLHLNPQKFQCTECGKCSANGRSLIAHMKSMHEPESLERRFECEVCHKKFAKQAILKSHMETHAEGNPDHVCKECGKGFVLESRLNIHVRNVHSTAYLSVCDQCGKSFRGRYALKYHLLEHEGAGKKRWPCDQCDAQLHSKFSLKRHKRISHHDGSKVYVCGECGKVALTEDALKSHKRYVHQRERIHKCTVCDKAFKASKVLKEHMTTHTGEDLYKCPHCPRKFKVNANLHHHRKRKHPKEWEKNRRIRQMSFKRVDLNTLTEDLAQEEQQQVVL